MRRLLSALTVAASVPVSVVLPVVTLPGAAAHPVTPTVRTIALPVSEPAAPGRVLAHIERSQSRPFDLVGATWRRGSYEPGAAVVQVRTHTAGHWTGWSALEAQDGGADGGSPDARRAARLAANAQAAEPVWVGPSDGVEARVIGGSRTGAAAPDDLALVLVDGGSSPADDQPGPARPLGGATAAAAVDQPMIYSRADWGADESLRRNACPDGPTYMPEIVMGFVHHTDSGNGYTRRQVPGIIRGIYAYHVRSNGWCDIGYNFLIDRFGRAWEGRYGGIDQAVLGAHTGGFNYRSFGASLIGTFTSAQPSSAMVHALEELFAWKLGSGYRDPTRASKLVAGSFSGSRYRAGREVTFDTISGHRDADFTTCPGAEAYDDLPSIRSAVRDLMGAGFVAPRASASSLPMAGGTVDVAAKVLGKQSWTLTVTDPNGGVVATQTGAAGRSSPVDASWGLTDTAGQPVQPGEYTMTLTGSSLAGVAAVPWSTHVDVTPPVTLSVPAQVGLDATVTPHGRGLVGHDISLDVASATGSRALGTFRVSTDGTWTAGTAVTVSEDLTWTAADVSATTFERTRTTRVGPSLDEPATSPTYVTSGGAVALAGTALPSSNATVTVMSQQAGADPVAGPTAPVSSDGQWSTSVVPAAKQRVWVVDARGLASTKTTVIPVSAPTATAPGTGYAGRRVDVTGNAGGAGVPVTLSARPDGGVWSTVATGTAASSGDFALSLPLGDTDAGPVAWRISTGYGDPVTGQVEVQPTFAPTVDGPRRSSWDRRHRLDGTAVPGDRVRLWLAKAGSGSWVKVKSAVASDDATWSLSVRFTRDTDWRVTSPAGRSRTGRTVIVPTLHAPSAVAAGDAAVLRGRGLPGHSLTLWQRRASSATWTKAKRTSIHADGHWQLRRHPTTATAYRVTSHRQTSRSVAVSIRAAA